MCNSPRSSACTLWRGRWRGRGGGWTPPWGRRRSRCSSLSRSWSRRDEKPGTRVRAGHQRRCLKCGNKFHVVRIFWCLKATMLIVWWLQASPQRISKIQTFKCDWISSYLEYLDWQLMTEVVCCLQMSCGPGAARCSPLRWMTILWRLLQMWGRSSDRDCLQTRHRASTEEWVSALLSSVTMSPASVTTSASPLVRSVICIWRQFPDYLWIRITSDTLRFSLSVALPASIFCWQTAVSVVVVDVTPRAVVGSAVVHTGLKTLHHGPAASWRGQAANMGPNLCLVALMSAPCQGESQNW